MEEKYGVALEVDASRGIFDHGEISLVGIPSLQALEKLLAKEKTEEDFFLDPLRFRENMYIAWDQEPWYEQMLINQTIFIGEKVKMRIDSINHRCVMVNVDPYSAQKDPKILEAVGKINKANFGVYCHVLEPGIIRVGDGVFLER